MSTDRASCTESPVVHAEREYDVIIVGARPAGASLAARLGAQGITVLLVDKARFPSLPEVPSCPIMYASSMALFDEIGFDESKYVQATTRVHKGIVAFEGYFQATLDVPRVQGRDYLYGFDRAKFDNLLWEHLAAFPSVTRRSGFTVHDVTRDERGRVTGIEGSPEGEPRQRVTARIAVVGADGRHSLIARKVGARVVEEQAEHTSTIHFAEWEGLQPATPDGTPALHIVSTGRGWNVLFFPSSQGRVNIATHVRSDRAKVDGDPAEYYLGKLRELPSVQKRLSGARQVGPILGVRKIANRYRQAGGPGWVLVGDALHHKDPIDGQGFHDVLVEAKLLAALLVEHRAERLGWQTLLSRYRGEVWNATHAMFESTMERLARDLYQDPPPAKIKTLLRWALTDRQYQQRFLLFLTRAIEPHEFRTPRLMAGVIARGLARDARRLVPSLHLRAAS